MGVVSRLVSYWHGWLAGRRESAFPTGITPVAFGCVLVGMFLAFAAVWPAPSAPGAPARILALHLPAWLAGSLVIALVAASLSLLVSLLPARRQKGPEDFVPEPLRPKGGWVVGLLLLGLPLIGAAGTVFVWHMLARSAAFTGGGGTLFHSVPPVTQNRPPPPTPPRIGIKVADLALMLIAAAITLAALTFAAWIAAETKWQLIGLGRRRKRRRTLATAFAEAVEAGLAALASEDDPRRAVIACYRRCEAAVASATHRRYSWQTPREYLKAALSTLSLPANPVATLLTHFEWARFGNAPVSTGDRDAAATALEEIRAALKEREANVRRGRHGFWR